MPVRDVDEIKCSALDWTRYGANQSWGKPVLYSNEMHDTFIHLMKMLTANLHIFLTSATSAATIHMTSPKSQKEPSHGNETKWEVFIFRYQSALLIPTRPLKSSHYYIQWILTLMLKKSAAPRTPTYCPLLAQGPPAADLLTLELHNSLLNIVVGHCLNSVSPFTIVSSDGSATEHKSEDILNTW